MAGCVLHYFQYKKGHVLIFCLKTRASKIYILNCQNLKCCRVLHSRDMLQRGNIMRVGAMRVVDGHDHRPGRLRITGGLPRYGHRGVPSVGPRHVFGIRKIPSLACTHTSHPSLKNGALKHFFPNFFFVKAESATRYKNPHGPTTIQHILQNKNGIIPTIFD